MPVLRLVSEEGVASDIVKDVTILGRDPATCDVVVQDGSVSRRHALIEKRPNGWVVIDQSSANGTFIEGHKVGKAVLLNGHELRLGSVKLSVRIEEDAPGRPVAVTSPGARSAPAYTTPGTAGPSAAAGQKNTQPTALFPTTPLGAGKLTAADAASILGVAPEAAPDEVRRKYQKLYNDLQVRLTNAPTPALKRMYQKSLADARAAVEALCPGLNP